MAKKNKKGTCVKCKRENISLVAHGMCWKCYAKDKAAKMTSEQIEDDVIIDDPYVKVEQGIQEPPKENTITEASILKSLKMITLIFEDDDLKLYNNLIAISRIDRRNPDQQIMAILDKVLAA